MATTQTDDSTVAQPSAATTKVARPGERDATNNLISIAYHALKSAEACAQYIREAEASGDEQLAQFFEEVRGSQFELAQEAKVFLAERLDPTDIDEDPPTVG